MELAGRKERNMRRIIYISTAVGLSPADVAHILESAQRNNAQREITGFLLYNGRNFLQLIEGPKAALISLMGTLRRDPRHSGMLTMIDEAIDERSCPNWSMHHVRLSPSLSLRREHLDAELPVPISAQARQMVQNFASLN
jgi:hypothetical protein